MADDASRRWDLDDHALLSHFNSRFPRRTSWTLLALPATTLSSLTGALCRKRCAPASLRIANTQLPKLGPPGSASATLLACAPTFATSPVILSPSSNSAPTNTATAALHPAVARSGLVQWKTPSVMWRRRLPGWGPRTLA